MYKLLMSNFLGI